MADGKFNYNTAKKVKKAEPIEFVVDDDAFHFTPPPTSAMTLDMIMAEDDIGRVRSMLDWLGEGLPPEEEELLIARLRDPDDGLDFEVLNQVIEDITSTVMGRPTPAGSGSRRQR